MAEEVLYRKYRPQDFDEVLGQEHIVSVLEKAVKDGTAAHAYLFAGSRGTGKTSIARIFARALGTSDNDLYEIDAASNRGIDDVRALREAVQTLPLESPQKVYIIDEAHMLTKEAFNALLKTLEEPPRHAIFILATTEIEKLPETIVSRCQTFRFRKPSQAILKDMVMDVAKKEGTQIEPAAAELVALLGGGSFRDTHGMLQKVITGGGHKITLADAEHITGAPASTLVNEVVEGITARDADKGLSAIRKAAGENLDMRVFLELILQKMRAALLVRFSKNMEAALEEDFTEEDFAMLKRIAADREAALNSGTLLELLGVYDNLRYAHIPSLPLELAVINLCQKADER